MLAWLPIELAWQPNFGSQPWVYEPLLYSIHGKLFPSFILNIAIVYLIYIFTLFLTGWIPISRCIPMDQWGVRHSTWWWRLSYSGVFITGHLPVSLLRLGKHANTRSWGGSHSDIWKTYSWDWVQYSSRYVEAGEWSWMNTFGCIVCKFIWYDYL